MFEIIMLFYCMYTHDIGMVIGGMKNEVITINVIITWNNSSKGPFNIYKNTGPVHIILLFQNIY